MIKIGFIDYFMDNYHAKNYPAWIQDYSNGKMKVTCAYALSDRADGGLTNAQWSEKYNIPMLNSVNDVIEQSDCIMVLSPSNPQMHETLSEEALKSGKCVYVDKAFAQDAETAKRMFSLADKWGTPCCSSSSLAFAYSYENIDKSKIKTISSKGPGSFDVYAIHQFEPVIALMGSRPVRVMAIGNDKFPSFIIEFEDGKTAKTEQFDSAPFEMYIGYDDGSSDFIKAEEDIFKGFILKLIEYFESGKLVAQHNQTLAVISVLDAAKEAMQKPFVWVDVTDSEKY